MVTKKVNANLATKYSIGAIGLQQFRTNFFDITTILLQLLTYMRIFIAIPKKMILYTKA